MSIASRHRMRALRHGVACPSCAFVRRRGLGSRCSMHPRTEVTALSFLGSASVLVALWLGPMHPVSASLVMGIAAACTLIVGRITRFEIVRR